MEDNVSVKNMLCGQCLKPVKDFPTYVDEVNPEYDEFDCPGCGYHNLKLELKPATLWWRFCRFMRNFIPIQN